MSTPRLTAAFDDGLLTAPAAGSIAVFRAQPFADYPFELTRVQAIQGFKPLFDQLEQAGYASQSQPLGTAAMALVHITRSKPESLGLVAQALLQVDVGALVLVDGAKTDGIESLLKRCKAVLGITGQHAKSHGRLFWLTRPEILPLQVITWAEALKSSRKDHGYYSAPGMFSPDKIDQGSLLLSEAFDDLKGVVADLGAGWGWLADQALQHPKITQLDLFEAEEIALNAARQNITDPRARFYWEDVLTMTPPQTYDRVICNPPFHQSRAAEPSLGLGFIAKAAAMLKPNGVLWLVANRQLPYETALEEHFAHWTHLHTTGQFKVIKALKPLHHRKSQKKFTGAR